MKIMGVDPDIPAANIIQQINLRNSHIDLDPQTCRVAISYKERSGNFTHVLEIDPSAYRTLVSRGQVLLGWTVAKVVEDFHVPMCTYCATYGHPRRSCPVGSDPNKMVCTKCAGTHSAEACTVRMGDTAVLCNECRKEGRQSSHPTGHECCPVLQDRVARMRARTDYG